jgi:hypothetical protein
MASLNPRSGDVTIQVEVRCPVCGVTAFTRWVELTEVGPLLVSGKWAMERCEHLGSLHIQAGVLIEARHG